MEKLFRYGEVRNLSNEEERKKAEESRTVEFVISNDSKDRHGTRMNMDNWQLDNFNSNGIVGYQHNVYGGGLCDPPNPDDVIGKGRAWIEEHKTRDSGTRRLLIGSVTFEPAEINPKAEKIFRKVLFGSLKAASVGIMPIGDGKYGEGEEALGKSNETFYFDGQELLEFSIVNIPSNTEALKRNITVQAEQGVEYLKRYVSDHFDRDINIYEMKINEVLEMLDGKTDNYFERIMREKAEKAKQEANELHNAIREAIQEAESGSHDEPEDLDIYFRKLKIQLK